MWNRLLSCQLPHLIEEDVQLELGAEVLEAAIAERLNRAIGNEGTQQVDVLDVAPEVGVVVRKWLLLLLFFLAGVHLPSHRMHYEGEGVKDSSSVYWCLGGSTPQGICPQ